MLAHLGREPQPGLPPPAGPLPVPPGEAVPGQQQNRRFPPSTILCPQAPAPASPSLSSPRRLFWGSSCYPPGPDFGEEEPELVLARKPCVHV